MRAYTKHTVHKRVLMGDRITNLQHLEIEPVGELYRLLATEK